jgi:hypothetical protein
VGGMAALTWFCWWHQLYRADRLFKFITTGRVQRDP